MSCAWALRATTTGPATLFESLRSCSPALRRRLLALDLQRDVDQLVLLAADQLALAGPEQDLGAGDAVAVGGGRRA